MAQHTHSHGAHGAHDHGAGHGEHHGPTVRVYLYNFAALMVLLVLTLVAAMFDLHEWNVVIAITIAVIKAVLVVLFFMHLRYSTKLVQVFGTAAVFWLLILFVLTFND